jgi:hypothetical protein
MLLRLIITFVIVLWAFSLSYGQTLSLSKKTSVSFNPNQQDYIEALLCQGCNSLEPFVVQGLEISATSPQALSFQVRRNSFLPTGELILEARYNVFDPQNNFLASTDWLEVSEQPQDLFSSSTTDFSVAVDYRLIITGEEYAGNYQTSLTYSLGSTSLRHELSVQIPSVTLLRVGQKVASGTTSISFNYFGLNASDYVRAIKDNTPLALTGSNLKLVEIFSNHPRGYLVTLKLFAITSPGTLNLRLFNKPIDGQTFQSVTPTQGFQPLLSEENFSLLVDGSEEPGDYQFTLEYNAESNP